MTLKLSNINRSFGSHRVLTNVSLEVQPGEKVALMGPNGCGKTTLLRIAAGIIRPTAGERHVADLSYVPQDAPVYPELTAQEHMDWWLSLRGKQATATAGARPAGQLSRGQRQRLHLEMAFASHAELLILDEPFTALDDAAQEWLEGALIAYPGAVIFAAHDRAQAQRITSRIIDLEAT